VLNVRRSKGESRPREWSNSSGVSDKKVLLNHPHQLTLAAFVGVEREGAAVDVAILIE